MQRARPAAIDRTRESPLWHKRLSPLILIPMPILTAERPLADQGRRFAIHSEFQPAGDQPQAIAQLVKGITGGAGEQVLLGVTGSGKTFTMAHVIAATQRPALILAP